MLQLIKPSEIRAVAGGSGIEGKRGVLYQTVDETPSRMFWWDGEKHVPMLGDAEVKTSKDAFGLRQRIWPNFLSMRRQSPLQMLRPPAPYDRPAFTDLSAANQAGLNARTGGAAAWAALTVGQKDYVTHPGLEYVPEGFGGYCYWLCYTPYPRPGAGNADATFENPCVVATNDFITLVEPAPNPIVQPPVSVTVYLADVNLYYDRPNKRMVLMYRERGAGLNKLMVMWTFDGITWTTPAQIWSGSTGSSDMASPSFWFDGTQWIVIAHDLDASPFTVRKMVNGSADITTGWPTTPTTITFPSIPISFDGSTWRWWHSHLRRLPDGRIGGLAQNNNGTAGGQGEVWLVESGDDGATFTGRRLDTSDFYRPTWCMLPTGDVLAAYSRIYSNAFELAILREEQMPTAQAEFGRFMGTLSIAKRGGVGATGAGILFADGFDRADSAAAIGTPDSGGTYSHADAAPQRFGIVSKRATPNDTQTGRCRLFTQNLNTANYSAALLLDKAAGTPAASGEAYVLVRGVDIFSNFIRFGVVNAGGRQMVLQQVVAGATTQSKNTAYNAWPEYGSILRVDCDGRWILAFLNGEHMFEMLDQTFTTTGTYCGFGTVGLVTAGQQMQAGGFLVTRL